jgi:hypothetical protein
MAPSGARADRSVRRSFQSLSKARKSHPAVCTRPEGVIAAREPTSQEARLDATDWNSLAIVALALALLLRR